MDDKIHLYFLVSSKMLPTRGVRGQILPFLIQKTEEKLQNA